MRHPNWMARLSRPARVASILDWNKTSHTVLAVNFHKNRVGIAVASHPSRGVPCLELEPLNFGTTTTTATTTITTNEEGTHDRRNRNRGSGIAGAIDGACLERFSKIIEEHMVCGVVVNWPLQRDTGRMGAACGRVVFALEQLWARSNESSSSSSSSSSSLMVSSSTSVAAPTTFQTHQGVTTNTTSTRSEDAHEPHRGEGLLSRPFCLWDAGHIDRADPSKRIDAFGRCASYGKENQLLSSSSESKPTSTTPNRPPLFETTTRPLLCNSSSTTTTTTSTTTSTTDRYFHNEHNYFAGREQYYEDEHTVVLSVWEDFCREHWPDLRPSTATAAAGTWNESGHSPGPPRVMAKTMQKTKTKKKKSLVTMR